MNKIESNSILRYWRESLNGTLGFVPTMGALHEGHISLIEYAKQECDEVLVSIFINPMQFDQIEDFEKYPQTLEQDLDLLRKHGVDAVWIPKVHDLYPNGMKMKITESDLSQRLCGSSRPGHFDGVLTVVMKLFQLTKPQKAFFGEKDFQQLQLIQKMANEFFLDIKIVPVPTLRENSGLALSSRNLRLSLKEKEKASFFYKTLQESSTAEEARKKLSDLDFKVDYVEDVEKRRFGAVWLGSVRLIDNVQI